MKDQGMNAYAGRLDTTAALSRDALEQIARSIYELSSFMANRKLSITGLYGALHRAANLNIITIGEFSIEVPIDPPGSVDDAALESTRMALAATDRSDWSQRLRNLPSQAKRISVEEMIESI